MTKKKGKGKGNGKGNGKSNGKEKYGGLSTAAQMRASGRDDGFWGWVKRIPFGSDKEVGKSKRGFPSGMTKKKGMGEGNSNGKSKSNSNSKDEIRGSLHCGAKSAPPVEMTDVVGWVKRIPFGNDKEERQRQGQGQG